MSEISDIIIRYKYVSMIIMSLSLIILAMLLNYNLLFINYKYSIIMYWIIFVTALNIRIIDNRFDGLLQVVPLSFAMPGTLLYLNIIDSNLILGLTYLVLLIYVLILSQKTQFIINYNIVIDKKTISILTIFSFTSIILMFYLNVLNDLKAMGLTNIIFFVIIGPIVEGLSLFLTVIYEHERFMPRKQLYDLISLANILFIPMAVSLNTLLMFLSIVGNSLKTVLGFKVGILLDYSIRAVVLALILMGADVYA